MPKSGQNPNIDDDTRSRARRFAADAGMPKPAVEGRFAKSAKPKQRVVGKKELEESGLSLRDFLNRERGLTRRGMSKAEAEKQLGLGKPVSKQEVAEAKAQIGLDSSPTLDPGATSRNEGPRRKPEPLSSVRKPGTNINYENTDTSDMMKRGGKVKAKAYAKGGMTRGDGICVKGKTKGRMI